MIKVGSLIRLIRRKQQDNNELKFSDYDILDAVNECIRYCNQDFAMKNSDFLEKVKSYRLDKVNGTDKENLVDFARVGIELPDDFVTLVSVVRVSDGYHLSPTVVSDIVSDGTYKIFGNRLYVAGDGINLFYRCKIGSVKNADDVINLPEVFIDYFVKLSGLILNNAETDVLLQAVSENISKLIPRRRYSNVKPRMPFIV